MPVGLGRARGGRRDGCRAPSRLGARRLPARRASGGLNRRAVPRGRSTAPPSAARTGAYHISVTPARREAGCSLSSSGRRTAPQSSPSRGSVDPAPEGTIGCGRGGVRCSTEWRILADPGRCAGCATRSAHRGSDGRRGPVGSRLPTKTSFLLEEWGPQASAGGPFFVSAGRCPGR
ncbi:hypothetical protein CZ771_04925 [Actinomycetales bacterium JB111]|nr:hypothetical protein CZ771_04925 [Actinomycetales bacterium JB111]